MAKFLCIEWSVNQGHSYGSPYPDTPEERDRLERQVIELRKAWAHGTFEIVPYPYAQQPYMPGPLATIVAARQLTR